MHLVAMSCFLLAALLLAVLFAFSVAMRSPKLQGLSPSAAGSALVKTVDRCRLLRLMLWSVRVG
jgi:hypothetical protein